MLFFAIHCVSKVKEGAFRILRVFSGCEFAEVLQKMQKKTSENIAIHCAFTGTSVSSYVVHYVVDMNSVIWQRCAIVFCL